jgi:hypothetical protein
MTLASPVVLAALLFACEPAQGPPGTSGAALVSDPQVTWSRFWSGDGLDMVHAVTVTDAGTVIAVGQTASTTLPTTPGYRVKHPFMDAYLTSDPISGDAGWASHLGGNGADYAHAVVSLPAGDFILVGATTSTDFPTLNAYSSTQAGSNDLFVSRVAADGGLLWSTLIGGALDDFFATAIASDPQGNTCISGLTRSTNFPMLNALDSTYHGGYDAFIVQFGPTGSLVASTYLGTTADDQPTGMVRDASGSCIVALVAGPGLPLKGASARPHSGSFDVYLAKLEPGGSALAWATYLGGAGDDRPTNLYEAPDGGLLLVGRTASSNFPVVGGFDATLDGAVDGFVAKLGPEGSLVWSSYLGGSGGIIGGIDEDVSDLVITPQGDLLLAGHTTSPEFPVAGGADAGVDLFLVRVAPDGQSAPRCPLLLGGPGTERITDLKSAGDGDVVLGGRSNSPTFLGTANAGDFDAFVLRLGDRAPPIAGTIDTSVSIHEANPALFDVTVTWSGFVDPDGDTILYSLGLGTTPGSDDVASFTSVGEATSVTRTVALDPRVTQHLTLHATSCAGGTAVAATTFQALPRPILRVGCGCTANAASPGQEGAFALALLAWSVGRRSRVHRPPRH